MNGFELYRGELAETALAAPPMVGPLDPDDDRQAKLLSRSEVRGVVSVPVFREPPETLAERTFDPGATLIGDEVRVDCAARLPGRRIGVPMPLQIDLSPVRGLALSGTLATSDVDRLVRAIRDGDAIALDFRSGVMSVRADAAAALFQRLTELWESGEMRRRLTLHAVPGAVADALQAAGFTPEGEDPAGHFGLLID